MYWNFVMCFIQDRYVTNTNAYNLRNQKRKVIYPEYFALMKMYVHTYILTF